MKEQKNVITSEEEIFAAIEQILDSLGDGANASLPSPEIVSTYALDADRKLFINAVVDYSITEITKRILRWNIEDRGVEKENRKPIWLYMMNFGGSIDYMWQLIDVIEASNTPVYTVDIGTCSSAAALIFIAGHKRFMLKRANIMIHEGSISASGDAQKFIDTTDSYKKTLKAMKDYIVDRTNIPLATLSRKKNNDWELDAKYCLEHGVCDVIVESLSEVL